MVTKTPAKDLAPSVAPKSLLPSAVIWTPESAKISIARARCSGLTPSHVFDAFAEYPYSLPNSTTWFHQLHRSSNFPPAVASSANHTCVTFVVGD